MTLQLRVGVVLPMIVALTGVCVGCALGATGPATGKALYRTYCGQCHALTAADAAGDASSSGPSFNDLELSANLTIVALTALRAPHAHVLDVEHMTWPQLHEIADFLAAATATNPHAVKVVLESR